MALRPHKQLQIEGLDALRKHLRQLDKELLKETNNAIKDAVKRNIVPRAKRYAPKGKTGKLARSIRPAINARGIFVNAKPPYAAPLHYGWPARGIKPRHFVIGAINQQVDQFEDDFDDLVEDLMDEVSRRINR